MITALQVILLVFTGVSAIGSLFDRDLKQRYGYTLGLVVGIAGFIAVQMLLV